MNKKISPGKIRPLTRRKPAKPAPCPAGGDLETLVAERTAQLTQTIAALQQQVAELTRASETQANAHRLLEAMLDNVPDRVYFKDTQSRFLKFSKAVAQRLGVKNPEEAVGKTDFDFNPADKAREFFQDEQRIIKTGKALINKTERHLLPNGEIAWTSTTKVPLRDKTGKVIGLVGINRDITEQKQAEEALRHARNDLEQRVAERTAELSRERLLLRTLIDNLPDAIYAKDTAGRKTLANPADLKNLRCKTEAEAIGKSDFDLFPPDIAAHFFADDQKVIQGNPVINREEFFFDEAGRKCWLLTSKLPMRDPNGKIIGLMGIGRDITKRKEVEEALANAQRLLQAMLDNVPDRIYFKDTQSRFLLLSKALAKRMGLENQEQAVGKSDGDFFPEEKAREFFQDEQRIIQTGQPLINKIEKQITADGEIAWASVTKVPLRDPEGKVIGLVGINRDLTDLKRAEKELERTHRRLLDVSRLAGMAEVATGVLHNVGNVLNSVNVSAALISEQLRESKAAGVTKLAKLLHEHVNDMSRFLTEDQRGRQVPAYLEQLAEHLEQERTDCATN